MTSKTVNLLKDTLPKFNSSPLQNGGWKTILSYWVSVTFHRRWLLNFRGGVSLVKVLEFLPHQKIALVFENKETELFFFENFWQGWD